MVKKILCSFFVFASLNAYASDVLDLDVALQNTYRACINIDENLHELKVLAGINTAVTAVGTAAGAGAGIKKRVVGRMKVGNDRSGHKIHAEWAHGALCEDGSVVRFGYDAQAEIFSGRQIGQAKRSVGKGRAREQNAVFRHFGKIYRRAYSRSATETAAQISAVGCKPCNHDFVVGGNRTVRHNVSS